MDNVIHNYFRPFKRAEDEKPSQSHEDAVLDSLIRKNIRTALEMSINFYGLEWTEKILKEDLETIKRQAK